MENDTNLAVVHFKSVLINVAQLRVPFARLSNPPYK